MADDHDPSTAGDDLFQAGIEQFQRAALDAIRAARTMLEAAETLVQEPAAAEAVVQTVSAFARQAQDTFSSFVAGATASAADPEQAGPDQADPDQGDEPSGGFERIRVD